MLTFAAFLGEQNNKMLAVHQEAADVLSKSQLGFEGGSETLKDLTLTTALLHETIRLYDSSVHLPVVIIESLEGY